MTASVSLGLGVIHYLSFQESSLLLLIKRPKPTGVTLMVEFGGRVTPKCPWTDSLLEQPNPLWERKRLKRDGSYPCFDFHNVKNLFSCYKIMTEKPEDLTLLYSTEWRGGAVAAPVGGTEGPQTTSGLQVSGWLEGQVCRPRHCCSGATVTSEPGDTTQSCYPSCHKSTQQQGQGGSRRIILSADVAPFPVLPP